MTFGSEGQTNKIKCNPEKLRAKPPSRSKTSAQKDKSIFCCYLTRFSGKQNTTLSIIQQEVKATRKISAGKIVLFTKEIAIPIIRLERPNKLHKLMLKKPQTKIITDITTGINSNAISFKSFILKNTSRPNRNICMYTPMYIHTLKLEPNKLSYHVRNYHKSMQCL